MSQVGSSFAQKYLSAQFTLQAGNQFSQPSGQAAGNQLTVGVKDPSAPIDPELGAPSDALRMSARVSRAGGAAVCQLELDVWGMRLSDMNTLSTLGYVATTVKKNTIVVRAGGPGGMATVFNGVIYDAYVDLSEQPEARFHVSAQAALTDQLQTAKSVSWNGSVDVATILKDIAGKLGVTFENNGVSVMLRNQYLYGSLIDQAQQAVDAAGIYWNRVDDGYTLAIWPPGQSRGGDVPVISAASGLVGYVSYYSLGIKFTTLFNPGIRFGGRVNIQSSQLLQKQTNAQGQVVNISASGDNWVVNMMNHRLDCLMPNGDWFTDVQASPTGYPVAP